MDMYKKYIAEEFFFLLQLNSSSVFSKLRWEIWQCILLTFLTKMFQNNWNVQFFLTQLYLQLQHLHYLHYYYTNIYAYNMLANYTTNTYTTWADPH